MIHGWKTEFSDEDEELLSGYTWHAEPNQSGSQMYVATLIPTGTYPRQRRIMMHNLIMGVDRRTDKRIVDHKNINGLDNIRSNLRFATPSLNAINKHKKSGTSSPFRGVSWNRQQQNWRVQYRRLSDKKQILIGRFSDEIEAAKAYDEVVASEYGEFATLNFPRSE